MLKAQAHSFIIINFNKNKGIVLFMHAFFLLSRPIFLKSVQESYRHDVHVLDFSRLRHFWVLKFDYRK